MAVHSVEVVSSAVEVGVDSEVVHALVARQLGNTIDVNLNVYVQSSVEQRLVLVNELERHVTPKQLTA
ncbi:MAG: hypothetical protein U0R19_33705 [Bryobacteraceae bacterium]